MMEDYDIAKRYMDRAVQTETPPTSPLLSLSPVRNADYSRANRDHSTTDPVLSPALLSVDGSDAQTQTSYALEQSGDTSPKVSLTSAMRAYKTLSVSHQKPPFSRTLKSPAARLVSLPETAPLYSAKKALEKTTLRIVSMPEHCHQALASPSSSLYSDQVDVSADIVEPFVYEIRRRARVRIHSNTTDMPHTPSPPSSPESIVIIANKPQLPVGFLRGNVHVEELLPSDHDDEGWITWAKSPPRPIPALHGPLSLPYARCPSGAEGTIIEEQDNLPRMIWGLEGEDMPSSRSRTEAISHSPTPRRFVPRLNQAHVPPRFLKPQEDIETSRIPSFPHLASRAPFSLSFADISVPKLQRHQEHARFDYQLPSHGPIDLTALRPQLPVNALNPQHDRAAVSYGPPRQDLGAFGMNSELGLDWQTILHAQGRLRDGTFASSGSTSNAEFVDYLRPSVSSASASVAQSLASSRSPINLESLGRHSHLTQATLSPHAPRRMSALEIAQKYRQQQQQQQFSMLPTPPSSSSPVWSSKFSPYQASLVSPELLAASRLPKAPTYVHVEVSQHGSPSGHVQSPRLRKYYQQVNNFSPTTSAVKLGFASSVRMHDAVSRHPDMSLDVHSPDLNVLDSMAKLLQAQSRDFSQWSSPISNVDRSPAAPKPPPNTPLSIHSTLYESQREHTRAGNLVTATPPSPTSPKPRLRSISHQPRSIPLARLVQRRLSSVPEEDLNSMADLHRTPSPTLSSAHHARSHSTSGTPTPARKQNRSQQSRNLTPGSPLLMPLKTSKATGSRLPAESNEGCIDAHNDSHVAVQVPANSSRNSVKVPGTNGKCAAQADIVRSKDDVVRHGNKENTSRAAKGGRGRGKGGRGKRGRGASGSAGGSVHSGPERADGGMTVRS